MTPIDRAKADIAKMRSEIGQLENRLEGLRCRLQKAEAYIEMSALYESESVFQEATRVRTGIAAVAVKHAKEMIIHKWEAIHTRDILKSLESTGTQIGGSNPVANLSGFLSRSEDLKNDRAKGWGLSEWGDSSEWPQGKTEKSTVSGLIPEVKKTEKTEFMKTVNVAQEPEPEPETFGWDAGRSADLDDDIPF